MVLETQTACISPLLPMISLPWPPPPVPGMETKGSCPEVHSCLNPTSLTLPHALSDLQGSRAGPCLWVVHVPPDQMPEGKWHRVIRAWLRCSSSRKPSLNAQEGARAALLCFPPTHMVTLPLISTGLCCPSACPTTGELPGLNRVLLILDTGMYVQ